MNDRKQSSMDDSEFNRALAATSRAYKLADADLPPPGMDDAIRAAARRAAKSKPQPIGKSRLARYSAPLSAAALVVLTVSIGFVALEERPELAPAAISEAVKPGAASSVSPTAVERAAETPSPAITESLRMPKSAQVTEKKVSINNRTTAAADPLVHSSGADSERQRGEAGPVSTGAIPARDKNASDVIARDSPPAAVAPTLAPIAKPITNEVQAFAASPAAGGAVGLAKREVRQEKQLVTESATSIPSPTLRDKTSEPPEAWVKRLLELKQQGKTREFDDELIKFRKRYPDYLLPVELKAVK